MGKLPAFQQLHIGLPVRSPGVLRIDCIRLVVVPKLAANYHILDFGGWSGHLCHEAPATSDPLRVYGSTHSKRPALSG